VDTTFKVLAFFWLFAAAIWLTAAVFFCGDIYRGDFEGQITDCIIALAAGCAMVGIASFAKKD
jgi:hypothetical protein